MIVIDTNLLLYALDKSSVKNAPAREYIQENFNKVAITHQNIFEALRVITHPNNPLQIDSQKVAKDFLAFVMQFRVISPQIQTTHIALSLIQKYQVRGNEVFDSYLVATALSNRITTIATDNARHMSKYQEIKVVNPFKQL